MARHSAYNKEPALTACGTSLLPFRTSCKGPVNTGKVPPPRAQLVCAAANRVENENQTDALCLPVNARWGRSRARAMTLSKRP